MKKRARVCGCGHEKVDHEGGKGQCRICGPECPKLHRGHGARQRKDSSGGLDSLTISSPSATAPLENLRRAGYAFVDALLGALRYGAPLPSTPVSTAAFSVISAVTSRKSNVAATPRAEKSTGLSRGGLAVLTALAQGVDGRSQLVAVTGYKPRSVTTYLGELRQGGLAEGYAATPKGIAKLGPDFKPLPTGAGLLRYWLDRLGTGEQLILTSLVRAYPGSMTRAQLVAATGYAPRSVTTYMGALQRRKITGKRGSAYVASDLLFDKSSDDVNVSHMRAVQQAR